MEQTLSWWLIVAGDVPHNLSGAHSICLRVSPRPEQAGKNTCPWSAKPYIKPFTFSSYIRDARFAWAWRSVVSTVGGRPAALYQVRGFRTAGTQPVVEPILLWRKRPPFHAPDIFGNPSREGIFVYDCHPWLPSQSMSKKISMQTLEHDHRWSWFPIIGCQLQGAVKIPEPWSSLNSQPFSAIYSSILMYFITILSHLAYIILSHSAA